MSTPTSEPVFRRDRQIKYYIRCLRSPLPSPYTSGDANRLSLSFFLLGGLDVLGVLNGDGPSNHPIPPMYTFSQAERDTHIAFVYACQLPGGGFRGAPLLDFTGVVARREENEGWDPGNVAATYFALVILLMLRDDLSRVDRKGCLEWLRRLQRPDGSFGEVLGVDGRIEGATDMRFCYCAAAVRYILRGRDQAFLEGVEDINVGNLSTYISACQTYEGGFAGAPMNESHAGLTYCALGTLSLLGLAPNSDFEETKSAIQTSSCIPSFATPGTPRFEAAVNWLSQRQTSKLSYDDDEEDGNATAEAQQPSTNAPLPCCQHSADGGFAGFSGRTNKLADTCYCFWVTGALSIMNRVEVIDSVALRRFALGKTQHLIGGFAKEPGAHPDLLHSYLGLSALGIIGECEIPAFDPALCTRVTAREHLHSLSWWSGTKNS